MKSFLSLGLISCFLWSADGFANELSSDLALEAAIAARSSCAKSGYHTTVTVVEKSGLNKVVIRADDAAPHTLDTSKGKAYTAVTFAALFNEDLTSMIAKRVLENPASAPLSLVPGIMLLGGGVAVRSSSGKVIGAIGVGGAPGGTLDEACAKAGLEAIKGRLP